MTLHAASLEIPANTPLERPVSGDWEVKLGVIHAVHIVFPSGCVGLVGARVCHGPRPVFPSSQGEWFVGEDESIVFVEHYNLTDRGRTTHMSLLGYNLDDTHPHTVYFRLGILLESELTGGIVTRGTWQAMRSLFTRRKTEDAKPQLSA